MLRFETDNDTGFDLLTAIQPVNNGENADQTVLRRPSENLRVRTNAIRQFIDKRSLLEQIYHHLTLTPENMSARIHFDGSKFYINADGSSGTSTSGLLLRAFFKDSTIYPMAVVTAGLIGNRNSFLLKSQKSAAAGGNNIKFEVVLAPGASSITVTTTPESPDPEKGPVLVTATCPVITTFGSLQSALSTNAYVRIPYVSSSSATVPALSPFYLATVSQGGVPPATTIYGTGGTGRTEILITATQLNNFFSTNSLSDGDVLAVAFTSIEDVLNCNQSTAVTLVKVSATDGSGSGNMPLGAGSGTGLSDDLVIPIATVIGTGDSAVLLLRNGRVFTKTTAGGYFTYGPFINSGNVDMRIAAAAKTGTTLIPLAEGTVYSQIEGLQDAIEDHIDTGVLATPHSLKKILHKPFVTVGTNGDYTSLNAAVTALLSTGGTIMLLEDVTLTASVSIASLAKDLTIYGNNKTISCSTTLTWLTGAPSATRRIYITDVNITSTSALVLTGSNNVAIVCQRCRFSGTGSGTVQLLAGAGVFNNVSVYMEACSVTQASATTTFIDATASSGNTVDIKATLAHCVFSKTRLLSGLSATVSGGNAEVNVVYSTITIDTTGTLIYTNTPTTVRISNSSISTSGGKIYASTGNGYLVDFQLVGCTVNTGTLIDSLCHQATVDSCEINATAPWVISPTGAKPNKSQFVLSNTISENWDTHIFQESPAQLVNISGVNLRGDGGYIISNSASGTESTICIENCVFAPNGGVDKLLNFGLGNFDTRICNNLFWLSEEGILYQGTDVTGRSLISGNTINTTGPTTALVVAKNASVRNNRIIQRADNYITVTLFDLGVTVGSVFEGNILSAIRLNTGVSTPLVKSYAVNNNEFYITAQNASLVAQANTFTRNFVSDSTGNKLYGVSPLSASYSFVCLANEFSNCYRGVFINTTQSLLGIRISDNRFVCKSQTPNPPGGINIAVDGAIVSGVACGNIFIRDNDIVDRAYGFQTSLSNNGKIRIAAYGNYFSAFTAGSYANVWSGISDANVICFGYAATDTHPYVQSTPTNLDKFLAHQIVMGA